MNQQPQAMTTSFQRRANKDLSKHEKELKRDMKKKLKVLRKINKIKTQIRHSQVRKDPVFEQKARLALQKVMDENKEALALSVNVTDETDDDSNTDLCCYEAAAEGEEKKKEKHVSTKETICTTKDQDQEEDKEMVEFLSICKSSILKILVQILQHPTLLPPLPPQSTSSTTTTLNANKNDNSNSIDELNHSENDDDIETLIKKRKKTKLQSTQDIQKTRELFHHMTKGSQQREMFASKEVLIGYTRHKFNERAYLVVTSISKMMSFNDEEGKVVEKDDNKYEDILQKLEQVDTICSIGCGPGNDVVGLLVLLHQMRKKDLLVREINDNDEIIIKKIIFLDYAMRDWKKIVIPAMQETFKELTSTTTATAHANDSKIELPEIMMESCDVTYPTFSQSLNNMNHMDSLKQSKANENMNSNTSSYNDKISNDNVITGNKNMIVLISYLLTETRQKWREFMMDFILRLPKGTLFYFAEPMTWQLHILIQMFGNNNNVIKFTWLDSSFEKGAYMQNLDGRLGSAVLMGIKVV